MEPKHFDCGCCAQDPYPEVRCQGRNLRYAEAMLSNMAGTGSEMSAVSLYFYNHLVTSGVPEIMGAFQEISIVEMHHLKIFGALALQLGGDPRLWSAQRGRRVWWSPDDAHYTRKLGPLMHHAIQSERATIRRYENQIRWIRDPNIQENLRRIIVDERLHVELLLRLCDRYIDGGGIHHSELPVYYD